ncbi:MAG: MFS transporter [Thermomicrobiales bacterium]
MNAGRPPAPAAGSTAAPDSTTTERPQPAPAADKPRGFAALHSRYFRLLWIGLFVSNSGTWMNSTAQGWLVTDLDPDGAAKALGMIAAAFAVPMLVLPPLGGAVADRVSRLRLLFVVQCLYVVLTSLLAVITLTDRIEIWMLMVFSFFNGVVLAFDAPCRNALVPDLVTPRQLTSAISLNSAAFTGAALIGPALAGGLIPFVGVGGVFAINTATYVAVFWALLQLRGVPLIGQRRSSPDGVVRSIGHGIDYVRRSPLLLGLLTVSIITGVFGRSFGPLLAVFARDVFDVGSLGFGVLVAAPGLGTLCGAIGLAAIGDLERRGRWIWRAAMIFAVALLGIALSGIYVVALPLLVLVGLFSTVASALIATLIQLHAPAELRGRLLSFYSLTVIGVPSAGALISGTVADATGVRAAVGGGAVLVMALVSLTFIRNRAIRSAT